MKNIFAASLLAMLLIAGCSFNSPSKYTIEVRTISIESLPTGANVYLINPVTDEKTLLGATPLIKQPVPVFTGIKGAGWRDVDNVMTQLGTVRVAVVKSGYEAVITNLSTDPNKTATHKITLSKTAQ